MSSERSEDSGRARAVVARSTRVAKRVARWQRRLWLFESVIGPLLAVTLATGLAVVGWRLIRGRRSAEVRPTNSTPRRRPVRPATGHGPPTPGRTSQGPPRQWSIRWWSGVNP